jgi:plastocyanin
MEKLGIFLAITILVSLCGCLSQGPGPENVELRNASFQPNSLTVDTGTTVTWSNHNGTVETVTAKDGSFDSGDLTEGYEFRYTFLEPGTYYYYSKNNPAMQGEIIVNSSSPATALGATPAGPSAGGYTQPSSTINLMAKNIAFNLSVITVTAGSNVAVNFDNQDASVPHNFAVYETEAAQKTIFRGKIISGPAKIVYNFKAPAQPGTYFFRCDVHPTLMNGQFVVVPAGTSVGASQPSAPHSTNASQQAIPRVLASNASPAQVLRPSNVIINLTAKNIAFNKRTITVPAGANVTVNFDNQDANVPHNFAVYETEAAQQAIFQGKIISGPAKIVYNFKAPAQPGTYFFRCDVHPTLMKGQFVVQSFDSSAGALPPSSQAAQPTSSPVTPAAAEMNMQAAQERAMLVEIKKFTYNPNSITVPPGTSVIWRNLDPVSHTVTSSIGKFDSGVIEPGGNYSHRFQDPGKYAYHCTIHPNMTAQVVVANPVSEAAPANVDSSKVGVTDPLSASTAIVPVSTTSPQPSTKVIVDLLAKDMSFDKNKITVIAGSEVFINFVNLDVGVPHNFAVYTGSEATTDIFQGQIIVGPAQITYSFDAPVDDGIYFFRCDVHPKVMTGDFYVVSSDELSTAQAGPAPQSQSVLSMSGSASSANISTKNASLVGQKSVTVNLTAENIAFDKNTITVPAGASVTVNFDNRDSGVPHNFAVYDTEAAEKTIFQGKIVDGPAKITYTFMAPSQPGTYFFRCDIHPTTMKGQFIVE